MEENDGDTEKVQDPMSRSLKSREVETMTKHTTLPSEVDSSITRSRTLLFSRNMNIVELTLLDLTEAVENDENGEEFTRILDKTLVLTAKAEDLTDLPSTSRGCRWCCWGIDDGWEPLYGKAEDVKNPLLRYIRVQDRYDRLASLLLKSQAFHMANETSVYKRGIPVVELPRTSHGKPYIPGAKGEPSTEDLSVSHQHPFAGMARLIPEGSNLKLGMDLVTFQKYNTKLYRSELDFVKVFKGSFSPREWRAILEAESSFLEFHVRWSIKEAYTKALGLGMGLDFKTFETRLKGVGDSELWNYVKSSDDQSGLYIQGTVSRQDGEPTRTWAFYFLKLFTKQKQLKGSVCVCYGPLPDNLESQTDYPSKDPEKQIVVSWTTLQDLINWHLKTRAT